MMINSIKRYLGKIIFPKSLINDDPKILHISDTPNFIFPEIINLIDTIKPEYIIHTGDVSDDVKLELYPWKKDVYEMNIRRFSKKLEKIGPTNLFISVGNHDDREILLKYFRKENVFDKANTITVENIKISFSHYIEEIEKIESTFYLFGHNKHKLSSVSSGKFYLNGIQGINIINLKTLEITSLRYPVGTDDSRQSKRKIGL